jgi:hypothetical protein
VKFEDFEARRLDQCMRKAAGGSNEWSRVARESRVKSSCKEEGTTTIKKQERITTKQTEDGTRPGGWAGGGLVKRGRTGGGSAVG